MTKKKRIILIVCSIVLLIAVSLVFATIKYYSWTTWDDRYPCLEKTKYDPDLRCSYVDDDGITKHCRYVPCCRECNCKYAISCGR